MDEYEKYDSGALLNNKYLKVADISEGSYGLVSVAKDTTADNKLVAIKFIYPIDYKKDQLDKTKNSERATSSPARLRSNFVKGPSKASILRSLYEEASKEIKIHKILGSHPNISSLYDHFDSCLVLDYCSRGDLYEAIQNGLGPSASQDIKDVFLQVLNALEFCHSHGVYHRDLKPENILISEDWSIKLCDWGLATTTRVITNKSEFDIGSERYMAPELFDTQLESYDASKIDLWSVGIILLTLVFHKNPFQVANYSDKRFLQFAANREALFDIFSSMSGEMFSVLRYSLNIDPTNRDLDSLKTEVTNLKYFTYDEEDWASDYDDYEEGEEEDIEDAEEADIDEADDDSNPETENVTSPAKDDDHLHEIPANYSHYNNFVLNYNDADDINFHSGTDTSRIFEKKDDNNKVETKKITPPIITTTDTEHNTNEDGTESDRLGDSQVISPKVSSEAKFADSVQERPYNHRADALLSASTDLKPIPISYGGLKFIRNTRKPFKVASYSQSHKYNSQNYNTNNHSKFPREEFFTPKSMVSHYMDKFGEQKLNQSHSHSGFNNSGNGNNSSHVNGRQQRSEWKKNGKKRQSWNTKNGDFQNNGNGHRNHHQHYHNSHHGNSHHHKSSNGHNKGRNKVPINGRNQTSHDQKRKHGSLQFSSSQTRKHLTLSSVGSNINNTHSNPLVSSFHALNFPLSNNSLVPGSPGSSGKYIPPYLRSPNYTRSPVIEAVTEEIDHLTLDNSNADDEVFHLEGDFELGLNHTNSIETHKSTSLNSTNATSITSSYQMDNSYKKPHFKAPTYQIPGLGNERQTSNGPYSNGSSGFMLNGSGSHRGTNGRRHSINKFHDIHSALTSSACSSKGKYIPPFRRGSHSAATGSSTPMNTTGTTSKPAKLLAPNGSVVSNGNESDGGGKRKSGLLEARHLHHLNISNNSIDGTISKFENQVDSFGGFPSTTKTISSSVPSGGTDWFPKKNWVDFDDN